MVEDGRGPCGSQMGKVLHSGCGSQMGKVLHSGMLEAMDGWVNGGGMLS